MRSTHHKTEAVATRAWTEGRIVFFELTDQRIVGFPANRFRRLRDASEPELAEVRLDQDFQGRPVKQMPEYTFSVPQALLSGSDGASGGGRSGDAG